jgi:ABC-type sugar transport system substrate-binding protein
MMRGSFFSKKQSFVAAAAAAAARASAACLGEGKKKIAFTPGPRSVTFLQPE